jgi:hypothetical protein
LDHFEGQIDQWLLFLTTDTISTSDKSAINYHNKHLKFNHCLFISSWQLYDVILSQ